MQMPGSSEVVSLADLIQVACANRRRARVRLSAGDQFGVMHLADGEVIHASFGRLEGNTAVYAALSTPELTYQVDPDMPAPWRNVSGTPSQLVLEAARLADEGWTPNTREISAHAITAHELSAPVPRVSAAHRDEPPAGPPRARPRRLAAVAVGAALTAVVAGGTFAVITTGRTRGAPPPAAAAVAAPTAARDAITVDAAVLTGVGDEPPRLLEGAPALRPAVDLALTPTIVCRIRIDTSGAVAEAKVFRSRLDLTAFEDAALAAVQHYRFRPARQAGALVGAWINWPVTFRDGSQTTVLHMKGSDTIGGALGPALAKAYATRRPDVQITVEALGSATAFAGLFDGSADIGASSRPVNPKEMAEAQRLGVRLSEVVLGYDGLAIIVHPSNRIASLDLDTVARLFRGDVQSWKEVGGPDLPVHRFSRPSSSGTYEFFRDRVLRHGDPKAPGDLAPDARLIESSRDVATAVAADPAAIGYVGMGWATSGVRAVPLRTAAAGAPIAATAATVRDGTYPIYRTLLLYTRGAPRGEIAPFLAFALSPAGQALIEEHGFVAPGPGADAELAAAAPGTDEPAATGPTLATRIEFDAGVSQLAPAARADLRDLARKVRDQHLRLLVIGNADGEGTPAAHEALSLARARAVADFLAGFGVGRDAISVESAAATRPLDTNTTRAGRSHNRRVDVFYVK